MNNNDKQFLAEKIRTQYVKKESTELDKLRALDAKVKRPANVFAYIFGSIGAVVMGGGMSLIMTDIAAKISLAPEKALPVGLVVGIVGLVISVINYPIYKGILSSRKKKYADEIIKLSESIVNE